MKIQPVGDKVIILPDTKEEKTAGGILIPETSQKKTNKGTVYAASQDIESKLNPGDEVLYSPNAGTPITIDGKEHLLLLESNIWAVIKK
jgi:chaperonin GroES